MRCLLIPAFLALHGSVSNAACNVRSAYGDCDSVSGTSASRAASFTNVSLRSEGNPNTGSISIEAKVSEPSPNKILLQLKAINTFTVTVDVQYASLDTAIVGLSSAIATTKVGVHDAELVAETFISSVLSSLVTVSFTDSSVTLLSRNGSLIFSASQVEPIDRTPQAAMDVLNFKTQGFYAVGVNSVSLPADGKLAIYRYGTELYYDWSIVNHFNGVMSLADQSIVKNNMFPLPQDPVVASLDVINSENIVASILSQSVRLFFTPDSVVFTSADSSVAFIVDGSNVAASDNTWSQTYNIAASYTDDVGSTKVTPSDASMTLTLSLPSVVLSFKVANGIMFNYFVQIIAPGVAKVLNMGDAGVSTLMMGSPEQMSTESLVSLIANSATQLEFSSTNSRIVSPNGILSFNAIPGIQKLCSFSSFVPTSVVEKIRLEMQEIGNNKIVQISSLSGGAFEYDLNVDNNSIIVASQLTQLSGGNLSSNLSNLMELLTVPNTFQIVNSQYLTLRNGSKTFEFVTKGDCSNGIFDSKATETTRQPLDVTSTLSETTRATDTTDNTQLYYLLGETYSINGIVNSALLYSNRQVSIPVSMIVSSPDSIFSSGQLECSILGQRYLFSFNTNSGLVTSSSSNQRSPQFDVRTTLTDGQSVLSSLLSSVENIRVFDTSITFKSTTGASVTFAAMPFVIPKSSPIQIVRRQLIKETFMVNGRFEGLAGPTVFVETLQHYSGLMAVDFIFGENKVSYVIQYNPADGWVTTVVLIGDTGLPASNVDSNAAWSVRSIVDVTTQVGFESNHIIQFITNSGTTRFTVSEPLGFIAISPSSRRLAHFVSRHSSLVLVPQSVVNSGRQVNVFSGMSSYPIFLDNEQESNSKYVFTLRGKGVSTYDVTLDPSSGRVVNVQSFGTSNFGRDSPEYMIDAVIRGSQVVHIDGQLSNINFLSANGNSTVQFSSASATSGLTLSAGTYQVNGQFVNLFQNQSEFPILLNVANQDNGMFRASIVGRGSCEFAVSYNPNDGWVNNVVLINESYGLSDAERSLRDLMLSAQQLAFESSGDIQIIAPTARVLFKADASSLVRSRRFLQDVGVEMTGVSPNVTAEYTIHIMLTQLEEDDDVEITVSATDNKANTTTEHTFTVDLMTRKFLTYVENLTKFANIIDHMFGEENFSTVDLTDSGLGFGTASGKKVVFDLKTEMYPFFMINGVSHPGHAVVSLEGNDVEVVMNWNTDTPETIHLTLGEDGAVTDVDMSQISKASEDDELFKFFTDVTKVVSTSNNGFNFISSKEETMAWLPESAHIARRLLPGLATYDGPRALKPESYMVNGQFETLFTPQNIRLVSLYTREVASGHVELTLASIGNSATYSIRYNVQDGWVENVSVVSEMSSVDPNSPESRLRQMIVDVQQLAFELDNSLQIIGNGSANRVIFVVADRSLRGAVRLLVPETFVSSISPILFESESALSIFTLSKETVGGDITVNLFGNGDATYRILFQESDGWVISVTELNASSLPVSSAEAKLRRIVNSVQQLAFEQDGSLQFIAPSERVLFSSVVPRPRMLSYYVDEVNRYQLKPETFFVNGSFERIDLSRPVYLTVKNLNSGFVILTLRGETTSDWTISYNENDGWVNKVITSGRQSYWSNNAESRIVSMIDNVQQLAFENDGTFQILGNNGSNRVSFTKNNFRRSLQSMSSNSDIFLMVPQSYVVNGVNAQLFQSNQPWVTMTARVTRVSPTQTRVQFEGAGSMAYRFDHSQNGAVSYVATEFLGGGAPLPAELIIRRILETARTIVLNNNRVEFVSSNSRIAFESRVTMSESNIRYVIPGTYRINGQTASLDNSNLVLESFKRSQGSMSFTLRGAETHLFQVEYQEQDGWVKSVTALNSRPAYGTEAQVRDLLGSVQQLAFEGDGVIQILRNQGADRLSFGAPLTRSPRRLQSYNDGYRVLIPETYFNNGQFVPLFGSGEVSIPMSINVERLSDTRTRVQFSGSESRVYDYSHDRNGMISYVAMNAPTYTSNYVSPAEMKLKTLLEKSEQLSFENDGRVQFLSNRNNNRVSFDPRGRNVESKIRRINPDTYRINGQYRYIASNNIALETYKVSNGSVVLTLRGQNSHVINIDYQEKDGMVLSTRKVSNNHATPAEAEIVDFIVAAQQLAFESNGVLQILKNNGADRLSFV